MRSTSPETLKTEPVITCLHDESLEKRNADPEGSQMRAPDSLYAVHLVIDFCSCFVVLQYIPIWVGSELITCFEYCRCTVNIFYITPLMEFLSIITPRQSMD